MRYLSTTRTAGALLSVALLLLLLLLLGSCQKAVRSAARGTLPKAAPAQAGGAVFAGVSVAPPPVTDAQLAQGVLDRWLAAQDSGDFSAYRALYAPAFAGVKRVGTKVKTLDRAAWMKDREKMFKAPMAVGSASMNVTADGATLVVELEQRWEQGAFADLGEKRIVLDRAAALAGGAAILGEEMLTSRVLLTELACVRTLYPDA